MGDLANSLYAGEPPGGLTVAEVKFWRDSYDELLVHGYKLRDRYCSAWEPSWRAKGVAVKAFGGATTASVSGACFERFSIS